MAESVRPLRLLLVPGAIREEAYSPRIARLLEQMLVDAGHEVTSFDLRTLPMMGIMPKEEYPPTVDEWQDGIQQSDAVLWVVPTYHGEMPGVVKNALDLVGAKRVSGQFHGIVGASSRNGRGGAQALAACLRTLGGRLPVSDHFVMAVDKTWDEQGALTDPAVAERLATFAAGFTATVALLRDARRR